MNIFICDTHLVIELDSSLNHIYAIGYNYNSINILIFFPTPGMGFSFPGKSFKAWWCVHHSNNIHVHFSPQPIIISYLIDCINVIYMHNHSLQCELTLRKIWVVKVAYCRLATIFLGLLPQFYGRHVSITFTMNIRTSL